MTKTRNVKTSEEQEIFEQVNKIVLLKIKALIVKNLRKEDIPEFEQTVKENNISLLLTFAQKKVPHLSKKIYLEMEMLGQKITKATHD